MAQQPSGKNIFPSNEIDLHEPMDQSMEQNQQPTQKGKDTKKHTKSEIQSSIKHTNSQVEFKTHITQPQIKLSDFSLNEYDEKNYSSTSSYEIPKVFKQNRRNCSKSICRFFLKHALGSKKGRYKCVKNFLFLRDWNESALIKKDITETILLINSSNSPHHFAYFLYYLPIMRGPLQKVEFEIFYHLLFHYIEAIRANKKIKPENKCHYVEAAIELMHYYQEIIDQEEQY